VPVEDIWAGQQLRSGGPQSRGDGGQMPRQLVLGKNAQAAAGESLEPEVRERAEQRLIRETSALVVNTVTGSWSWRAADCGSADGASGGCGPSGRNTSRSTPPVPRLLLAGVGDDAFTDSLHQQARTLGIEDRIAARGPGGQRTAARRTERREAAGRPGGTPRGPRPGCWQGWATTPSLTPCTSRPGLWASRTGSSGSARCP
jgi:hypothetical protein